MKILHLTQQPDCRKRYSHRTNQKCHQQQNKPILRRICNQHCNSLSNSTRTKEIPENSMFSGKFALLWYSFELSLWELRCTTSSLQTVLKFFDCRFSLIFRAFLPFQVSVVLFLNHKNRYFFNQKPSDVAHHLPPQKAPLVYCTSLLHRCP